MPSSIGIDLGTTYSCVATMHRGKVDVIANKQGDRTTPSCVSFTNETRLIGDAAIDQKAKNAANTVYDAKRLLGRPFDDPVVQTDIEHWPFKVVNTEGKPQIQVEYKKKEMFLFPEEISSMILSELKECAEVYLDQKVKGAVITVPAHFNDAQRRATRDAAGIANINILGLINEPTAAAIAYGLERETDIKRNILIFDLGGGTFDVTVLTMEKGDFDVRSTSGDTHLGGEDFSNRMFNHLVTECARKNNVDVKENQKATSRLRIACEKAKRTLSTANRAEIDLDALIDGKDFESSFSRARFEQLNDDLFRGTLETVEVALTDAGIDKDVINEVVLVGGSTRIPYIQRMLSEYFGNVRLCQSINPDEAVAYGAAIYAASLSGDTISGIECIELRDVTPLSLGVETKGGVMSVVVKRNTKIPTQKLHNFTTIIDNQETVQFRVFEGERAKTEQNNLLGNFEIRNIPNARAGNLILKTCFEVDSDGVLDVSAREVSSGASSKIQITQGAGRFTEEEIERMVKEAERYRKDDDEWRKKVEAFNSLETLIYKAKVEAEQNDNAEIKATITSKCDEVLAWMRENKGSPVDEVTKKMGELEATLAN